METPILPPAGPSSLSRTWLVRGLVLLPLLIASYFVFIAPQVRYVRYIDLRAPDVGAGGGVQKTLSHALLELRDRAVILSGTQDDVPGAPRLQLLVRKAGRSAEIYRQIMEPPMPDQVVVRAVLPGESPAYLNVDASWTVAVETRSDYARKVWRRLWVLLLGVLCSAGLTQLIAKRAAPR